MLRTVALCCWSRYALGDFDIVYGNFILNCKMYEKLNFILILVTVKIRVPSLREKIILIIVLFGYIRLMNLMRGNLST